MTVKSEAFAPTSASGKITIPQEALNDSNGESFGRTDRTSEGIDAFLPSKMPQDDSCTWADCDDLRTSFTLAMSAMYKEEVPLYSDLVRIVSSVNKSSMTNGGLDPEVLAMRFGDVSPSRLDVERHGAIRLGTAEELQTIQRVFAVLGLFPVGYYDLSEAGLPMHATCFRPITRRALRKNPFRVFTSVLRPELIRGTRARSLAQELTSRRNIFSDELLHFLDVAAMHHGRLTLEQSPSFIVEALKIFRWQGKSIASPKEYSYVQAEHPILADITCFGTSHINHLTPRTLDISIVQEIMKEEGMRVKDRIEGPPPRACPILLRQTSFLAIEESITFCSGSPHRRDSASDVRGLHRARFGEIEERGAAVTLTGRALYDKLVHKVISLASSQSESIQPGRRSKEARESYDELLHDVFSDFPDDWDTLRRQNLVFFSYRLAQGLDCESESEETHGVQDAERPILDDGALSQVKLEDLVGKGTVEAVPITYEDFLPLSAAGIFESNIGSSTSETPAEDENTSRVRGNPDVEGMEEAMQAKILSSDLMYESMQQRSIDECASRLGVRILP